MRGDQLTVTQIVNDCSTARGGMLPRAYLGTYLNVSVLTITLTTLFICS